MAFSEPAYDYDTECFLKEQRDYQKYYNTPFELDGMWYASLSHYDMELRMKQRKQDILDKLTIDLKSIIREMVLDIKIEKMYRDMDTEFPRLKSK